MTAEEQLTLEIADVLRVLCEGEMEVLGRLPYASNATLLTRVTLEEVVGLAVYKPRRGESPLWDFPDGTLCLRERAVWVVDATLGWQLVPPTVLREGPAGLGMVQLFVDEEPSVDFDRLFDSHLDQMAAMAMLDAVVNNADRKAGHCLLDKSGRLWAIDHGVTFNEDPKLRTVIWAFAGQPIPDALLDDLTSLLDELRDSDSATSAELAGLLQTREIAALTRRVEHLSSSGRFPEPPPGRRHVPWPPW